MRYSLAYRKSIKSRSCYACGTDKTYIDKLGINLWFLNHDTDKNVLCKKCFSRYIDDPKWNKKWAPVKNALRYKFKDKIKRTKKQIRKDVCSKCGRKKDGINVKLTSMDHLWYDNDDPTAGRIEVCTSCHTKRHAELRLFAKLIIPDLTS